MLSTTLSRLGLLAELLRMFHFPIINAICQKRTSKEVTTILDDEESPSPPRLAGRRHSPLHPRNERAVPSLCYSVLLA
jgi:hypothetical protein